MIYRPPSYLQCVAIARVARWIAENEIGPDDGQLRDLIGGYASNIIAALIDRRLLRNVSGRWELSDEGKAFAAELRGADVGRGRHSLPPLTAEGE